MLAVLLVAIGVTKAIQHQRLEIINETIEQQQGAVVTAAFERIQTEFTVMQEKLLAQGEELAQHPVVLQALQQGNSREIISFFADLQLPERWAVELYDTSFSLLAWNGFSIPLSIQDLPPVTTSRTAIAKDNSWRRALVVWVPVGSIGSVRVMQLIEAHNTAQNEFLRNYSVEDTWQQGLRIPVHAHFQMVDAEEVDSSSTLVLIGFDDTVLGRVVVDPPTAEQLLSTTHRRFGDVIALWAALLLAWIMGGLWIWQRGAEDCTVGGGVRLCIIGIIFLAVRFGFLLLNVPGRWQLGKAPLNMLFDPSHLASSIGGGLLRSPGDGLITALFAVVYTFVIFDYARSKYTTSANLFDLYQRLLHTVKPVRFFINTLAVTCLSLGAILVLAIATHQGTLNSTLDFFARDELIPTPLILIVSYAIMLGALSVILLITSLMWIVIGTESKSDRREKPLSARSFFGLLLACISVPISSWFFFIGVPQWLAWGPGLPVIFLVFGILLAVRGHTGAAKNFRWLMLRSIIPIMFLLGILAYPFLYQGSSEGRHDRMEHVASIFGQREDPHTLFAVKDLLSEAYKALLEAGEKDEPVVLNTLAVDVLRNSLLCSLGLYEVSLLFLDSEGNLLGGISENMEGEELDQVGTRFFEQLSREMPSDYSAHVRSLPVQNNMDRFQYAGIFPASREEIAWILVSAEPYLLPEDANTSLLRLLMPSGNSSLYDDLSIGEFEDGLLIRSVGRSFRRHRMDEEVQKDLVAQKAQWRREEIQGRKYETYYQWVADRVVAVRIAAVSAFDHLFYLLRISVAGLLAGLPFYLMGLVFRRQAGQLPASRVQFRDKVLNAFLVVGVFTVVTVGLVGVNVVTEENNRAIQSWLRQHLQQVDHLLKLEAQGTEMPYEVLERISLDSLAAQAGLDLNLYKDNQLVRSSRPELLREHLIDVRLPIQALAVLNTEGFQFAFVENMIGDFSYTSGYWALLDEQGATRTVLAVPTLPEQERIEEERSRTLAYLFGALLVLIMVVMLTASLLASALSRPIARLQKGLRSVARGHFEGRLPVYTRDEIGELVDTFNDMQEELSESQRKLSQQERHLAWSEMARQVAHEIKNPLTPMKLSLQHLRRAYTSTDNGSQNHFGVLFDRITTTLGEQIDSLAFIANEFALFGRMPTGTTELVDCNEVIREAMMLMREALQTCNITFTVRLGQEPLIVEADRERLRRVYINLLKNAQEAFDNDQEGQIIIVAHREEGTDEMYSAIGDTGRGIPVEEQAKIFEPNFSTKTSGAGLGLAIARRCIEDMDGSIGFETESGQGTVFWVRLPLVPTREKNI